MPRPDEYPYENESQAPGVEVPESEGSEDEPVGQDYIDVTTGEETEE